MTIIARVYTLVVIIILLLRPHYNVIVSVFFFHCGSVGEGEWSLK